MIDTSRNGREVWETYNPQEMKLGQKPTINTDSNKSFSKLRFFLGDVRDYQCIKQSMMGIDKVFHLAALIAIPYSYLAPSSYIDTNRAVLEIAEELVSMAQCIAIKQQECKVL